MPDGGAGARRRLRAAMKAAVTVPMTVKCRIGMDDQDPENRAYVCARGGKAGVAATAHARKAWLKGLSPKENRELPPLDYGRVYRLKATHPDLTIVLNGGIDTLEAAREHLAHVDGVMVGRAAYQEPWRLLAVDPVLFGEMLWVARNRRLRRLFPIFRARIGGGHAASCHHPASAWTVPRRARRARFPAPLGRGCRRAAGRRKSWLLRLLWC